MTEDVGTVLRAYRFALDLTPAQEELCRKHAGAARWAFNHALAQKMPAWESWQAAIEAGVSRKDAPKVPSAFDIQKAWIPARGDSRSGIDGLSPWWHEVSSYVFSSAFADADAAFNNWRASLSGKRAGPRMGKPQFKKKGRSRDSFRMHHNVKKPTIRTDGSRRIIIPRFGSLRVHDSTKRLRKAVADGAVVQSVTVSRGGHRWYASVLVKSVAVEARPSRRQLESGRVGVDIGVRNFLALSTGEIVDNPRHLARAKSSLTKAQRALARTEKGSSRRRKAAARVGRLHHQVAERRSAALHQVTKRLATEFAEVAIEDLDVSEMTKSAKGTVDSPGQGVRSKSRLNRALLDVAPGEFRRQLEYKAKWYGSRVVVCNRYFPSSQTCSSCGAKTKLSLSDRVFRCPCGHSMDRDVNAAINIAKHAV